MFASRLHHFIVLATLREIYHPDEAALAALSEEFGAYKYIDFQDSDSANSSAAISRLSAFALLGITLVLKTLM
jgi:hypothetical protein